MAEHQLPKLTVRVRFPSSAREIRPCQTPFFANDPAQPRLTATRSGPPRAHDVRGRPRFALREPHVEGCCDRLVGHSAAVLIDQGSSG